MASSKVILKVLMKEFLSEEKEYIKFRKKDNKDILVFEKKNLYIFCDVLCGIESRKKEKYTVGDIYLLLCLPKDNYSYSYINSIGYKYISVIERSKIISTIQKVEAGDELKVNVFIYDTKQKTQLNDYADVEKEQIINVSIFQVDDNYTQEHDTEQEVEEKQKDKTSRIPKKEKQDKERKHEHETKIETQIEKEECIVYFDDIRKICDVNKIHEASIFYINDEITHKELKKKNCLKKQEILQKGTYNFLNEDISTALYDEYFYLNENDIMGMIEQGNEGNTNFEFVNRRYVPQEEIQNSKEITSEISKEKDMKEPKETENEQNEVKHLYEHNYFKNIFFKNSNIYSLVKNTYLIKSEKEEQIIAFLNRLSKKCKDEYTTYFLSNVQPKHTSSFKNLHSLEGISDFLTKKKKKGVSKNTLIEEDIQNNKSKEPIILLHELLYEYLYALENKEYYQQKEKQMKWMHNFLKDLLLEEEFMGPEKYETEKVDKKEYESNENNESSSKLGKRNISSMNKGKEPLFKKIQKNCLEVKSHDAIPAKEWSMSNEMKENNEELIKSVHIKEINFKGGSDVLGKDLSDFSKIYNYFENTLMQTSSIKNVYINGIKKTIVVEDSMKRSTANKTLKIIDEIHLKYKQRPIIIIPRKGTAQDTIIHKHNIESFFLHNNLEGISKTISKGKSVTKYEHVPLIYTLFNKSIKFLFVENDQIYKFSDTDWKCVIAIIVKSNESFKQLNGYPFEKIGDLLQHLKVIAFTYNNEKVNPDFVSDHVEIIKVDKHSRKYDTHAVHKFWKIIEKFILQRREKKLNFKKSLHL